MVTELEDSLARLERIGADLDQAPEAVKQVIRRRISLHLCTTRITRALDAIADLQRLTATDQDVFFMMVALLEAGSVADDLRHLQDLLASACHAGRYEAGGGFTEPSAHAALWHLWAAHVDAYVRRSVAGGGKRGPLPDRVREAKVRWDSLSEADQRRSIPAIRREAKRVPVTGSMVHRWQADLWSESFRADARLEAEQARLSAAVTPAREPVKARRAKRPAAVTSTRGPRQRRIGKHDRALVDLLFRELLAQRPGVLHASNKVLVTMLAVKGSPATPQDIRADRTPFFRELRDHLKTNRSMTKLPARLRQLIPVELRADLESL